MKYQFIKSLNGVRIYTNKGKYCFVESLDENHCEELSSPFNSIEECENAVIDMMESNLF